MRWLVLAVVALSSCVTFNKSEPVAGWPALDTTVNYMSGKDMRDQCQSFLPTWSKYVGGVARGCTWIDLCAKTCEIWVEEGDTLTEEHERGHCNGHDHVGDSTQSNLLAKAKLSCQ